MEQITSRKNATIRHVRLLAADGAYRREAGEYLCDGIKMLREALYFGAEVRLILWKEQEDAGDYGNAAQAVCPKELFDYASPMANSPGPLFTVKIPEAEDSVKLRRALILEGVQDPGNVGTVIRTANAFGVDAVILLEGCADLYQPKTVRSTMGAIFRQRVTQTTLAALPGFLKAQGLPLYGAALASDAQDVRTLDLHASAVAVGSEGRGLSAGLLDLCEKKIILPMQPDSESLNAAVAASLLMWEMAR